MVSRQNGKGGSLEAMELWALYVNEEQVYHTAHNVKTAKEHFRRLEDLIVNCKELKSATLRISHNNGDEQIELRNGARLMFGTRTKGAARGMTFDRIVCDEAMYLTDEHMTAIKPTTMAVPNAQTWYTGSAGVRESLVFGRLRARALRGDPGRLAWLEWSIDPHSDYCPRGCTDHDDHLDPASWAKANPALGDRISLEALESASVSMSREGFMQEHLGVGDWPTDGEGWAVIDSGSWKGRCDDGSQVTGKVVLAVDVTPNRKFSCIALAGLSSVEGSVHGEILVGPDGSGGRDYMHRPGMQWVIPAVKEFWQKQKPAHVVIDKTGPAGSFIPELEAAGVKVVSPTVREYAQGCGELYSAVVPSRGEQPKFVHLGQVPLDAAVAGADRRVIGDLWGWDKKTSASDISPLVAVTLAFWSAQKLARARKSRARFAWG